jgi:hypothetical protein
MSKKLFPRARAVFMLAVFLFLFPFASCKKDEVQGSDASGGTDETPAGNAEGVRTHVWFAFTGDGFEGVAFPSLAKKIDFSPWTEAVRVCDAAMLGNGSSRGAFFLVNGLGMLTFSGDGSIKLARDASYFSNSTVDSLFIASDAPGQNGGRGFPVFHHYINAIFNSADTPRETVVIRFDPDAQVFYPVLLKREIKLDIKDEVSAVSYNGKEWLCQIRLDGDSAQARTDYRAYSFLESLSAPGVQKNIVERAITQDEFRNSLQSESFAESAPERLKNLLPAIPPDIQFFLECRFQDLSAPKRFSQESENPDAVGISGYAVVADTYVIALFEDGTVYFQGALTGYPSYRNNEVTVFKLPALGDGFSYGVCTVSGGKLFAAWEEKRFYVTARSGFVQVNLDSLLYGNAR